MNLDYYVLWYEDSDEYYESAYEQLELWFDEMGFRLHIDRYKQSDKLDSEFVKEHYDLIIVDLNLNGPDNGDMVIRNFRDKKIYTDVIFYSAKGAGVVREAVVNAHGIDGVYCADKGSFNEDVIEVIETTIKKILSVNGMRRLTMAAVGELDQHIEDCLRIHHDNLPEEEKTVFTDHIKRSISGMMHSQQERFDKKRESLNFSDVMNAPAATGILKLQVLQGLVGDYSEIKGVPSCKEKMQCYREEVQEHRNVLAHVVESIDDGKKILINKRNGERYNEETFKEIRRNIIEHETNFSELKELLGS
ncbi:MAG: hypothetical protein JAZ17_20025 [Candidatus Thiodiazotropha endolucinida]|nr:hypothetical protein [Candidatus Thiodiazotropha endolucinida]